MIKNNSTIQRKQPDFYAQLAVKRNKLGSWSEVVNDGFCTEQDITLFARGYSYFKWGIKPHIKQIGVENYRAMCSDLKIDAGYLLRDHYGINIENGYRYANTLGLNVAVKFKRFLFGSDKSKYSVMHGNPDNDCSVRAIAGMLDISYDESQGMIQGIVGKDPCVSGIDMPELQRVCEKVGLSVFGENMRYGRKSIDNISGYDLYSMIPQLKEERISLGVYRHIYYVEEGTVFDSRPSYLHNRLRFMVCKQDTNQKIFNLLADGIDASPDTKRIAYERWANGTSWNKLAVDLQIDKRKLKCIAATPEYLQEVKTLMFNWRTKDEFKRWVKNKENRISEISTRMGIKWSDAFESITSTEKRHEIGVDNE